MLVYNMIFCLGKFRQLRDCNFPALGNQVLERVNVVNVANTVFTAIDVVDARHCAFFVCDCGDPECKLVPILFCKVAKSRQQTTFIVFSDTSHENKVIA